MSCTAHVVAADDERAERQAGEGDENPEAVLNILGLFTAEQLGCRSRSREQPDHQRREGPIAMAEEEISGGDKNG